MMGRRCYNPTPAAGVSRRFGSEKASSISSSLSFSVPLSSISASQTCRVCIFRILPHAHYTAMTRRECVGEATSENANA